MGLSGGGPAAVITTLGVFRFDPEGKEAYLASYHPRQSVKAVTSQTGWPVKIAGDVHETPSPTEEEVEIVRGHDPGGSWTR